jgi:hypothetical protein
VGGGLLLRILFVLLSPLFFCCGPRSMISFGKDSHEHEMLELDFCLVSLLFIFDLSLDMSLCYPASA